MNIIIINNTINTTNLDPNKFSTKISRGDNKSLLFTLPANTFEKNGWKILRLEEIFRISKNTLVEKIQTITNSTEYIKNIIFFRANTLITRYWEEIKLLETYKILYIDDMHSSKEIQELRALGKNFFDYFNLIISTYAYCFRKFFNYISQDKIYWFPHSFNELFKIEYNTNPINKIFLSGCICEAYPMRQKMLELESKFPIDVLTHPKYCKNRLHNIIGKKFIEKINEYRFAFTCCSTLKTPYLIQKFFEIPGSGALLIGYGKHIEPQLIELGFIDMINYVSVSEENLEEKLQWVLNPDNLEQVEQIRINGYNFVNSQHTHENRATKFIEYLNLIQKIEI